LFVRRSRVWLPVAQCGAALGRPESSRVEWSRVESSRVESSLVESTRKKSSGVGFVSAPTGRSERDKCSKRRAHCRRLLSSKAQTPTTTTLNGNNNKSRPLCAPQLSIGRQAGFVCGARGAAPAPLCARPAKWVRVCLLLGLAALAASGAIGLRAAPAPGERKAHLPALLRDDHLGVERVESVPEVEVVELALEGRQSGVPAGLLAEQLVR